MLSPARIFFVFLFLSLLIFLSAPSIIRSQAQQATESAKQATESAQVVPNATESAKIAPAISWKGLQKGQLYLAPGEKMISDKIDPTGNFFEDELIVHFKSAVSDEEKAAILNSKSLKTKWVSSYSKSHVIKVDPAQREKILKELKADPKVEYTEPNYVVRPLAIPREVPDDLGFSQQWALEKIKAPEAWSVAKGSGGKYIAVIDTGVNYDHPDLAGKVILGRNYFAGYFGLGPPMDDSVNSHGTRVAGIAAAITNNGIGIAGTAWFPKIIAIKVLNWVNDLPPTIPTDPPIIGGAALLADAILYASETCDSPVFCPPDVPKADVINLSWALSHSSNEVRAAVQIALGRNVIVVAGAYNGSGDCFMGYPAAYEGVIAVAATNRDDKQVSGCQSPRDDEGNQFRTEGITVTAPGEDIYSTNRFGGEDANSDNFTSFATAFVSGALATYLGYMPTEPNAARNALIASVDDLGTPGYDPTYGHGRLNFCKLVSGSCPPSVSLYVSKNPSDLYQHEQNVNVGETLNITVRAQYKGSGPGGFQGIYLYDYYQQQWLQSYQTCAESICEYKWNFSIDSSKAGRDLKFLAGALDIDGNSGFSHDRTDAPYVIHVGDGGIAAAGGQNRNSLPPYLSQPTVTTSGGVKVNLNWTDTSGESSFYLQKKIGTGSFADFAQVGANTTSYQDTLPSSQEGKNLTYRVRAKFSDNSYSTSNERSIDTPTSPGEPTSSPLTVTTYCTGNEHVGIFSPWAKLEWNAKSGYTGQYKAQYRKSGGSWITKLTGGTELYSTDALENNSTYEFKVLLADNTLWAGPVSKSISCTLTKPQPGSGNPQVSNQYCLGSSVNVRLTWNEYKYVGNPNPTYRIYMKYPGDLAFGYVGATTALAFSTTKGYGNRSLRDNTEIAWQVNVNSSPSDVWWGDTPYTRTPTCKADIVAESLQVLPVDGSSKIEPGESVNGIIWLKNNSSIPAYVGGSPFKIRLWADKSSPGPQVGDSDYNAQTGTTLNAYEGKQIIISFTAPSTPGSKKAWIIADAVQCYDHGDPCSDLIGQVRELDENNNTKYFNYTVFAPPPACDVFGDLNSDGYLTRYSSASDLEMIRQYIGGTLTLTDEQKRRADVTGDGQINQTDIDKITAYMDNTITTFPVCEDTDNDGLPNYEEIDADNDGFANTIEQYLGTDPFDACPDNTSDPAWPLDLDNNGVVLMTGDVTKYTGNLFKAASDMTCTAMPGGACRRLDLDGNGVILMAGDVTRYTGKLFSSCSN